MKKQRQITPSPCPSRSNPRGVLVSLILVVLSLIGLAIGLRAWLIPSTEPADEHKNNPVPAVSEPSSSYGALLGRWLRTDGDYVLEIRGIDGNGKADLAYYNPRPINVARAEASRQGETLKLVVVLEDVGYPGSHYTLSYAPSDKSLIGQYYQATLQETFDVTFVRFP